MTMRSSKVAIVLLGGLTACAVSTISGGSGPTGNPDPGGAGNPDLGGAGNPGPDGAGNPGPGGEMCSDACIGGATKCSGTGLTTCARGADGCLAWTVPAACSGRQTCSLGFCGDHGAWVGMSDMPEPRTFFGLATTADHLYAAGGENPIGPPQFSLASMDAYSFATGAWTSVAPMPASRSSFALMGGPDGRIYALGGHVPEAATTYCVGGIIPDCTWTLAWSPALAYSPAGNSWTSITQMPTLRLHMAGAVGHDGLLYTLGGGAGSKLMTVSTVEAYNPRTNAWQGAAGMPTPRARLAAVTGPDGRIYALGGFTGEIYEGPGNPTGIVEAYTPSTNTWQSLASMPTPRISFAAAVGIDGRIYAIGGTGPSGPVATVEAYSPATNTWATVTSLPGVLINFAAALGPSRQLLAVGGQRAPYGQSLATVEAYTP